jgi:hypothetical protein
MALASWLRLPKYSFASSVKKASPPRQTTRRQPLRSRLHLECLEDRMLLSSAASIQFGGLNNPALNSAFNTQEVGIVLPQQGTANPINNPLAITQIANSLPYITLGPQADLAAQSHLNDQFRAFAVNSQGQGNSAQMQQQQFFFIDAYGFGSGVQPNAPWKPAAYNVGLANHQFSYASQSDNGFQSVPPWYHLFTQPTEQTQPRDEPLATEVPDAALVHHQANEDKQFPLEKMEESDGSKEKMKPPEDKTTPERGDPAIEDALFGESSYLLTPAQENRQAESSHENFADKEGTTEEEGTLPNAWWLSTLAPAQIAALVVGLPAVEAPAASGEVAACASGAD